MISPQITELVREIFAHYGEKRERRAVEDPEACLVALLTVIKRELPHVWATLGITVEQATFESSLEEAREQLQRAK